MMSQYLLDTNIFSGLIDSNPKLLARLASLKTEDRTMICTIVRGEILYGLARMDEGRRRERIAADATRVFALLPCVPIPNSAAEHYASIKVARQRLGLSMDENDLWIAATAMALGAVLVTNDQDFSAVADLKTENWLA